MFPTRRHYLLTTFALTAIIGAFLLYLNFNTVAPILADWGRAVLGPERVAQAETVLFRFTDWWQQTTYNENESVMPTWGMETEQPVAVESGSVVTRTHSVPTRTPVPSATVDATVTTSPAPVGEVVSVSPSPTARPTHTATPLSIPTSEPESTTLPEPTEPTISPSATATHTPIPPTPSPIPATPYPIPNTPIPSGAFPPAAIAPYLSTPADGEGIWSPLAVAGATGEASPFRYTFYRPDPDRPYAYVALVAVDLNRVRLGMVAGTKEPASPVSAPRPGIIPDADRAAGQLLATFNGGLKAANGNFGMMSNGTEWLPPLTYHGTIVLHNGQVMMGDWGVDMEGFPQGTTAWRQTPPLLVRDGALHPELSGSNAYWWGTTIDNNVVTWRSGMGVSADGQTLYYGVGPALSAETLARAFVAAGASDAAQLDINGPYVRFLTYDSTLTAQKLLADMAATHTHYITADERDFFYLVWK